MMSPSPSACFMFALSLSVALAHGDNPDIPIAPGVTFVLAVDNSAAPQQSAKGNILQGDYEVIVTITGVSAEGVDQTASMDGFDESGTQRQGIIKRRVRTIDLANSHLQIFGFHTDDPPLVDGATSLGPSLTVIRELAGAGSTTYSFRNFASQPTISGTLMRSNPANVGFPVLVNDDRVVLDAIRATGQMSLGGATRPFETVILNHASYPLSLRVAYGPRNGGFPFKADFARDIVRIVLPNKQTSLAEALDKDCRVEVPGIYFDFNQATVKPQSQHALKEIATVLEQSPQRRLLIEGHTDNVGSDGYNDELSARRAAAVKGILVRDFGIDATTLSTAGYGERNPIESNDTMAGRARNRRVELVCAE